MIFVPVNVFVILVHTLSIERAVLFSVEWLSNNHTDVVFKNQSIQINTNRSHHYMSLWIDIN